MIGQQYGKWTVLGATPRPDGIVSHGRYWRARCECGREEVRATRQLTLAKNTNGGCLYCSGTLMTKTHGMSQSPEFGTWSSMIDRCHNPSHRFYRHYGGRGIHVCERWRRSFAAFYADMGPRPGSKFSLDRIDNDLGYEPGNCRWADWRTQANNKRQNRFITLFGETMTATQWAERAGISLACLLARLANGWSVERALTIPVGAKRKPKRSRYTITALGKTMNLQDWSQMTGIPIAVLWERIFKRGWDAERAMQTPMREYPR